MREYDLLRSGPYRRLLRRVADRYGCTLRECLRQMVDTGHTATEIARQLGIDRQRLYEYARAVGWQFVTTTELVDLRAEQQDADDQALLDEAAALAEALVEGESGPVLTTEPDKRDRAVA